MDFKVCSNNKCGSKGRPQPISNFHKKGRNRFDSRCRGCVSENKKRINKYKKLSKLGNMKKRKAFYDVADLNLREMPGHHLEISSELLDCLSEYVSDLVSRKMK